MPGADGQGFIVDTSFRRNQRGGRPWVSWLRAS
jgi:hypothetical protein